MMLIGHGHQEVMAFEGYATKYEILTTLMLITLLGPNHYGALKWGTMYKHCCNFYMVKPKYIKMGFNKI